MSAANPIDQSDLARLPRAALWVLAARLKTLGLSIAPVAIGTWAAAEAGGWRLDVLIATIIAAAAIQIGTNLWNDAADAASGVDGPERLGPPRMTALGLLDAGQVRRAAIGIFVVAVLFGLYLTMLGGWIVVAIGIVSLVLGYAYSMGPYPLSGTPLGEGFVLVFFGVVAVTGTVFLHQQAVTLSILGLGVITGLPAAAVLLINNHRDRTGDALGGRRTLAILIGSDRSRLLYRVLLAAALIGAALYVGLCLPALAALVPAAALGHLLPNAMQRLPISAALNRLIPGTAVFQILLLAGIAVGGALCG